MRDGRETDAAAFFDLPAIERLDAEGRVVALHALPIVPIVVVGLLMLGAEGRRPRFPSLLPARLLAGRLVGLPRPLIP